MTVRNGQQSKMLAPTILLRSRNLQDRAPWLHATLVLASTPSTEGQSSAPLRIQHRSSRQDPVVSEPPIEKDPKAPNDEESCRLLTEMPNSGSSEQDPYTLDSPMNKDPDAPNNEGAEEKKQLSDRKAGSSSRPELRSWSDCVRLPAPTATPIQRSFYSAVAFSSLWLLRCTSIVGTREHRNLGCPMAKKTKSGSSTFSGCNVLSGVATDMSLVECTGDLWNLEYTVEKLRDRCSGGVGRDVNVAVKFSMYK